MTAERDEFTCGYVAAIADLFRMEGSGVRQGELLHNIGGVKGLQGKGVDESDMKIMREIAKVEGVR